MYLMCVFVYGGPGSAMHADEVNLCWCLVGADISLKMFDFESVYNVSIHLKAYPRSFVTCYLFCNV